MFSVIDACKLNRNASMPLCRRLLILSILIIHNLDGIEGSRGSLTRYAYGIWKNKLDRGVISPPAAHGFLTLNSTYNKYESPGKDETRVEVRMEPTFVIEIDSLAWRMGLEIKLEVTWQDRRVWWRKDNITDPGDSFTFEPSILK